MLDHVLLFSGGLDSTTCLYRLREELPSGITHCLGVDYGQQHVGELEAARKIALDPSFRGSTWTRWQAPRLQGVGPANVFPNRNLMLISLAACFAAQVGAKRIVIGCNADDALDYSDCRASFLEAVGDVLLFSGLTLLTPLIDMAKSEVAKEARRLGVPIEATRSCYGPGMDACGFCPACVLRADALA